MKKKTKRPRPRNGPKTAERLRTQRINKILSLAGLASRRKADEWIQSGRVAVNGRVIRTLGEKALWGVDRIELDGRPIPEPSERLYVMLNKPFGYVCSLHDPSGRPVVSDLLKGVQQRLYPVGRLDFDSLGLLLFTNDGEWAHRLSHPRFRVPKTYKVTVEGKMTEAALRQLNKGVDLEDGFSGPAKVTLLQGDSERSLIRITVKSGRHRLVRRMTEALGYRTIHLIRTGFGPLELGDLKIGAFRFLEPPEVADMKKMVGLL
jgi:23S rRNA pseudouridine2605 synthase